MATGQISILSSRDIASVHDHTLALLENPGVQVHSDKVLSMLESAGADVNRQKMLASIPEALVRETLAKVPGTVKLCARNPDQDMEAPRDGPPYMATNGTGVYVVDVETGEKRQSMAKDLRDFMVISDALDAIDYVWPIVTAHDGPENAHGLYDIVIALENTTKHMQGEAMSAEEARAEIDAASLVVGGVEELMKRPIFSVIQCPICPLSFEKGSIEAVVEFAKAGIPVVSMSMALCGLTSPVALASTVAIVNAENLASFVISQTARTGAPVIYSSESTIMNMFTGGIHYGCREEVIIASAAGQMARHYRVPSMVGGFGAGLRSDVPGINVDPSELIFSAMTNLTATDFCSGLGGLDQAKGASLEQLIIDTDIWEFFRDIRKDVSFDEEHFALDVIRKAGPGGSFLNSPHTLRNMRRELFLPSQEKANLFEMYRLNRDSKNVVKSARDRARKILSSHTPDPLEPDVKERIHDLVRDFVGRSSS